MNIERKLVPKMTLQEFADKYNLTLGICEYVPKPGDEGNRFNVGFNGVNIR